MNIAVLVSLVLILAVVYIPGLNGVFNTLPLGWAQWAEILPLLIIPSVAAEVTKFLFSPEKIKFADVMADLPVDKKD
jgi:Ca2+-transporting ATPase